MISRPYHSHVDMEAMIQLLQTVRPRQFISDYPSVLDLRELISLPDRQISTLLWESDEGQLAGFALVDSANNLLFEINPDAASPEIEEQVVAWGMRCIAQGYNGHRGYAALDACCRSENIARMAFFEKHGFVRVPGESVTMVRSLADSIPSPSLPPGFVIRPVAGEQEVESYVALHQAAFATRNMTVEYRLAIMRNPDYQPELDLVAVAPEGALAALCVCQIHPETIGHSGGLHGLTDPVATHPFYRRRGLAKALLLTGLGLLKQRSLETAQLSTNGENTPMMHTARAAGFSTGSTIYWYSKAAY
jgi:mycothiol synthase